jgi:hypothetical protein
MAATKGFNVSSVLVFGPKVAQALTGWEPAIEVGNYLVLPCGAEKQYGSLLCKGLQAIRLETGGETFISLSTLKGGWAYPTLHAEEVTWGLSTPKDGDPACWWVPQIHQEDAQASFRYGLGTVLEDATVLVPNTKDQYRLRGSFVLEVTETSHCFKVGVLPANQEAAEKISGPVVADGCQSLRDVVSKATAWTGRARWATRADFSALPKEYSKALKGRADLLKE